MSVSRPRRVATPRGLLALLACLVGCFAAGAEARAQALELTPEGNPHSLEPLPRTGPGEPLFERPGGRLQYGLSDTAWASPDPSRHLTATELAVVHEALGATMARVPVFWPQVEPEAEERRWHIYDELYRELIRRGVRPLWTLYQTPRFAVAPLRRGLCRGVHCDDEPDAAHLGALTSFVHDLAARYPLSAAFEYRNEPNVSRDRPAPVVSAERYVEGLRAFYRGVKAARPAHRVLGLSLAIDDAYEEYLAAALRAGAAHAMDGLSLHPYWTDARPNTLALIFTAVRDVLAAHGAASIRLVPDEAGASTTVERSGMPFDEAGQRDRMLAWFGMLDRRDPAIPLVGQVDAALMFTTVDGTPAEGFGGYGWLTRRADGVFRPRPVFCAFREQVAGLATFKGSGALGSCPGNLPGRKASSAKRKRVLRSCPTKRSRTGKVCRCRTVRLLVNGRRKRGRRCGYSVPKRSSPVRRRSSTAS